MVLIIDDDTSICELIERNLGDQGYQTRTASSGEDGLRLAKQLLPSAIILDVVMPGIDGWAVLAALKTDAATANIPIIIATMLDEKQRGFELGAADYMSKPFSRDSLSEVLRRHLDGPSPFSILVVEDDAEARENLARSLREYGWSVVEASNGREAIEHMERACPDLILLDLMLPMMNGYDVIAEVRRRPEWHSIPIIVITGIEIDAERRHHLLGKVEQVLQKGLYGRDELLNEIRALIGEHGRAGPP